MPDRWTASALPATRWDVPDEPDEPRIAAPHRDLWGCGLTADQMHTMTTIKTAGEYL